jgi:hypothetical protein
MKVLAQIESDTTTSVWEIRLGGDLRAYCTCPSWRFSKQEPKVCKHLDRFACEDFDFIGNQPTNRKPSGDNFKVRALFLR